MTEKAFVLDSFGLRYPDGTSTGPWTFSLDKGYTGALCGPGGSGKTALLHSLAGLDTGGPRQAVASGRLQATGPVDLLFERPFLQILGPSVKEELSAAEDASLLPAGARSREREWLLEAFSLDALWDRPVRELSEGERQKLVLACLFLRSPALLLLDQPASSLDLRGKDALRQSIERFTTRGAAALIADPDWKAAAPKNTDRFSLFPKASSLPLEVSSARLFEGTARPVEGLGEPLIEFEGLEIRRGGRTVLRDISGRVCCGEIIALAGDNGSGKTSLLLTIAGLLKPAGGRVRRQDRRLRRARPALMLQESLWHLSGRPVKEDLAWARRGPSGQGGVLPVTLASLLNLEALLERPGLLLSRGEMQRIALAMALLGNAPLVCLDEPLRFLWEQERKAVARVLQVLRNQGVSLLIASPSEEPMPWADQVWRLARGRMEICRNLSACDSSVTLSSSAPFGERLR
jgi:energy-coupling factor transport system ATP-binding protein